MATKTISIDMVAYARLCAARGRPDESFSRVIHRAHWEPPCASGGSLLARLESLPPLAEEALARLESSQRADLPPEDPWSE